MSKKISKFYFKQFSVSHHRSSMKVGVDGVLIGSWTDSARAKRILDVGTGCGLIALIMAQRTPEALIDAIDIDVKSIEEATENFSSSIWGDRLRARLCCFSDVRSLMTDSENGYDLIISNPPYFNSGVVDTITARERARHQGKLSPFTLLRGARYLLNPDGNIAMVLPTDISASLETQARLLGYRLVRKCLVRGHGEAPYKRSLLQWELSRSAECTEEVAAEFLTLELSPGIPTEEYRSLCKDFYIRF